jgi:hypothetical protein
LKEGFTFEDSAAGKPPFAFGWFVAVGLMGRGVRKAIMELTYLFA